MSRREAQKPDPMKLKAQLECEAIEAELASIRAWARYFRFLGDQEAATDVEATLPRWQEHLREAEQKVRGRVHAREGATLH